MPKPNMHRRTASAAVVISLFGGVSLAAQTQPEAPYPSPSAAAAPRLGPAVVRSFDPRTSFDGESLAGWRSATGAWRAAKGEIIGRAGGEGNALLLLEDEYQDLAFTASFRCPGACAPGVLLRASAGADGTRGVLFSLAPGEMGITQVTLGPGGRIVSRAPVVAPPAPAGGAAPAPAPNPVGLGNFSPAQLGHPRVPAALRTDGGWNHLEVYLNGNTVRAVLNGAGVPGGNIRGAGFTAPGRIGLFVSGAAGAEARFREVGLWNLAERAGQPVEVVSPRFEKRHVEGMFYGEAATVLDANQDGHADVASGPYLFLGPDFINRREIYIPQVFAATSYPDALQVSAGDVTGDGYPDIVQVGTPMRPAYLLVNPGKEIRRWDRHEIIPSVDSEIAYLTDFDSDGRLEFFYGDGGYLGFAKPGADPTQPWTFQPITEKGPWGAFYAYGMGTGDIDGDGRADVLSAYGWWKQPATQNGAPWEYHPTAFGRWGPQQGSAGGARPRVYDVDGDGLNDVVTSLEAHGWGLAWFAQKRDAAGKISFERRMIMDDLAAPNDGVAFSVVHAVDLADVDGDGLLDIVTGKRWWGSFGENPSDPDYFGGAPVLYWFRLARGVDGVRFVPELIHNHSGVGAQVVAADVNRDGLADVVSATRRGTFLFLSRGRPGTPPR